MLEFSRFDLSKKDTYLPLLRSRADRGCEYSLTNLTLWGKQRYAFWDGFLMLFSQFGKSSVYPFPAGNGDLRKALDCIIDDAKNRGILCRITCMNAQDCLLLQELYPNRFRFYPDRDGSDYVYAISDLAELKGRKFQKKRNHVNRFWQNHPDCQAVPLSPDTLPPVKALLDRWFSSREGDFHLEQQALNRAFCHYYELELEGMVLMEEGKALAFCLGSALTEDTFDIHFEKAEDSVDGAYAAINQAFAQALQQKHPQLCYLNREDDMGIAGLRTAKLSYQPHHLVAKFWARLWEDDDED